MSTAFDEHPYPSRSNFIHGRPEWVLGNPAHSKLAQRRRSSASMSPDEARERKLRPGQGSRFRSRSYERSRSTSHRRQPASLSSDEKRNMQLTPHPIRNRPNPSWGAVQKYHPRPYVYPSSNSDSDSSSDDDGRGRSRGRSNRSMNADEAWVAEQKRKRNQRMLVTSMAVITSVAAANNLYQSKKAHGVRAEEVKAGRLSKDEAMAKRKKHLLADLTALGVGAVCVNNAWKGWERVRGLEN